MGQRGYWQGKRGLLVPVGAEMGKYNPRNGEGVVV